jgi:hypothetical protein
MNDFLILWFLSALLGYGIFLTTIYTMFGLIVLTDFLYGLVMAVLLGPIFLGLVLWALVDSED